MILNKDFIIHKSEVVEQYNEMHRNRDQGGKQKSPTIEAKIKEVQKCYKAIDTQVKDTVEESKKEDGIFSVSFNKRMKMIPNYMDNQFNVEFDCNQFGNLEDQRISEIDRNFFTDDNQLEEEPEWINQEQDFKM